MTERQATLGARSGSHGIHGRPRHYIRNDVGTSGRRMSDVEVLRLATANSRVLITFDMDFGGLIFRRGLKVPGLILLRFTPHSASEVAERILNVVRRDLPVAGHLVVIGRDMVRTVNIPERQ